LPTLNLGHFLPGLTTLGESAQSTEGLMCDGMSPTCRRTFIDPATKYCQGVPSISAFFAEMGGNTMSLFYCAKSQDPDCAKYRPTSAPSKQARVQSVRYVPGPYHRSIPPHPPTSRRSRIGLFKINKIKSITYRRNPIQIRLRAPCKSVQNPTKPCNSPTSRPRSDPRPDPRPNLIA
jgi:hypothetical protein